MMRRTALVGSLLLALFASYGFGQVLLLHGWHGDPYNWDECVRIMEGAPYSIDAENILVPSLPNEASLVNWTVNIARYIDSLRQDAHLTVIAHSFAATSTLFLLVVANHVKKNDLVPWALALADRDPDLSSIVSSLLSVADHDLFLRAASRLDKVFLYHAALGGGCYACSACGEVPLPLVCDEAVRDMCTLQTGKDDLFSAEEIASLIVPTIDIYGTHAFCLGQCLGAPDTDGMVQIDAQRLFLSGRNYHEVNGGEVCHLDFIIDSRHAAEDLIRLVFPTAGSLATVR